MDKIKEKIQRATRGFSDLDVWNLDETLARIINEATFKLAEEHKGYPDQIKGMTDKKWTAILYQISFGFGSYLEMRTGIYSPKEMEFKRLARESKKGMELFKEYFHFLSD